MGSIAFQPFITQYAKNQTLGRERDKYYLHSYCSPTKAIISNEIASIQHSSKDDLKKIIAQIHSFEQIVLRNICGLFFACTCSRKVHFVHIYFIDILFTFHVTTTKNYKYSRKAL